MLWNGFQYQRKKAMMQEPFLYARQHFEGTYYGIAMALSVRKLFVCGDLISRLETW